MLMEMLWPSILASLSALLAVLEFVLYLDVSLFVMDTTDLQI